MKIGIYGGSFNPPHRGHEQAVRAVLAQLRPDRVTIIPCSTPPHKQTPAGTPDAGKRLEMTRLAFAGMQNTEVSDEEIRRGGVSYTVDTLRRLAQQPETELTLLIGTDMLLSFEKWWEFEEILHLASLAVFVRGAGEKQQVQEAADRLRRRYGARISFVENDAVEVSSSEIRQWLPQRRGREYLSGPVYAYIIRHRLYGARPDFAWLREQAYAMLKPSRIPHVAGCEEEAVRLARRWGADEDEARCAGILHDITKKEPLEEQLLLCKKYDIMLDNVEQTEGKLLHAKTGAAIAGDLFGASEAVCSAIFWHTTGRAGMTLLEKIVYLADYIEPSRDFEGVETLRRLAYEDLDRALILGYQMSMEDMRSRGIVPHRRTVEALEDISRRATKG